MKKTNSVLLNFIKGSLFMAVLLPSVAFGQQMQPPQPKSSEDRAQAQTQAMKGVLSLTDEQVPKVNAVNLKYTKKMEEIMKSDKERQAKMDEMKSLAPAREAEMKKVLTADQYTKYQSMEAQRKQMMQSRMQNPGAGMAPGGSTPPPPPDPSK